MLMKMSATRRGVADCNVAGRGAAVHAGWLPPVIVQSSSPARHIKAANLPAETNLSHAAAADPARPLSRRRRPWQDVSYISVVLWAETTRIPRAEGCGPQGGANARNDMSLNSEIKPQQSRNAIQAAY